MRLITFGCSLTRQGSLSVNYPEGHRYGGLRYPGLVPSLAEFLDIEYVNYATSAGSNYYSLERFQNYYVTDYQPDDIILFQLTSIIRGGFSVRPINDTKYPLNGSIDRMKKLSADYTVTHDDSFLECSKSKFDYNVHFLANHKATGTRFQTQISRHGRANPNEQYARLLSTFHLLHKTHKKFLVWLGWHDALAGWDGHYYKYYEKYLNDNCIPNLLAKPYLEWCARRKLPFHDDMHPHPETSGRKYAQKVLLKKIKTLL